MRLDIGEAAAEQLAGAIDRQRLDGVGEFGAAVVAAIGQPLDGLVGQHRALRFEHEARDDVLRRDQLDAVLLAPQLAANGRGELGVGLEAGAEIAVMQARHSDPRPATRQFRRKVTIRSTLASIRGSPRSHLL